jgi:uroporphyrinogen-III decarboxylase
MTQMTCQERLLAALRGQAVDRVPWSPFLAYWWEHQPIAVQERGQPAFLRELGADALLRGFRTPFLASDLMGIRSYETLCLPFPGCEVTWQERGDELRVERITPAGTLTLVARQSAVGNTRFVVEHPVKRREDYAVLRYLAEHMLLEPDDAAVQREIDDLGEDGLLAPVISPFLKTPFQALVEHFVGTEQLVYDLMDYPDEVEATLEVMAERAHEAVRIAAASPAQAFITWEDSSTTNVSPALFRRYIAPELDRWGDIVHAAGKLLIHHACGHVRALLPIMAQEHVDALESLSPPPTGNVEIWDAQAALGPGKCVIGGIEPVHFETLDLPDLAAYVENLLDRMQPRGYILANSDSCPPGVTLEKWQLVTQIVHAR